MIDNTFTFLKIIADRKARRVLQVRSGREAFVSIEFMVASCNFSFQ